MSVTRPLQSSTKQRGEHILQAAAVTKRKVFFVTSALILFTVLGGILTGLPGATNAGATSPSIVRQSPSYCDGSGDNQPGDDCVRLHLLTHSAHPTLRGGSPYLMNVTTHPGLRTKPMVAEVQYRPILANGHVGSWWGHKRVLLNTGNATSDVHTITACAPTTPGKYQVRTAVWVENTNVKPGNAATSSTKQGGVSLSAFTSGASLTSTATQNSPVVPGDVVTSAPSSLSTTGGATHCTNSAEDEELIEYFNQVEFNEEIYIAETATATAYQLQLMCPDAVSSTIPGPAFSLTMEATDGSAITSCAAGAAPITISKQSLSQQAFCTSTGNCEFMVTFLNSETQAIYSETVVEMNIPGGVGTDYIPTLEAATLPICNDTLNPCILEDTCSLSATKLGQISLCEDPSNCTAPPSNTTYSINSNVYFQAEISNP